MRGGRDGARLWGSKEEAKSGGKKPYKQSSASAEQGTEQCQGSAKNTSAFLQNRCTALTLPAPGCRGWIPPAATSGMLRRITPPASLPPGLRRAQTHLAPRCQGTHHPSP